MATPLDLEFLNLAVQNAVFDRSTAEKCLEIVDLGVQRGRPLSAARVAVNLGFLDEKMAEALEAMARSAQGAADGRQARGEEAEGAFAIEGFELRSKLGRGPCGATYDAKRLRDGLSCAVKVLTRKFAKHPRTLAAILDEARAAVGFDQATAVALRDVVHASGRDLLVYDRVKGRVLANVLEEGPLETLAATDLAIELGRCLAAAHARGLCHGDLRPEKIVVESQGAARLLDFGLAHAASLAAGFGQSGVPFGHPRYLAPEVVQERLSRPTPASDIYALGVLLYQLCCGHAPFEGRSDRETLRAHLQNPLPPPPEEVHVSTALAGVILRLTAKDPARRLDTRAAVAALEDYKKARLAGKTSDPESKANAALDAGETISKDDWGKQSADASAASGEWSADRIDKAERVGPEEFTPDLFEEESLEPGRIAAAGAGAKASGYKKALEEAAAGFASVEMPAAASRTPSSAAARAKRSGAAGPGTRLELQGNSSELAASRRTKRFVLGVLLLLLALGAVAYGYGRKQLEPPPAPRVDPGEREPPPDLKKIADDRERALARFIESTQNDVKTLLGKAEFQKALEAARAANQAFSAEPAFAPVQQKLLEEVRQSARGRFLVEKAAFEERFAANDFEGAAALARRMLSWAIEDLVPRAQTLLERAEAASKEEARLLAGTADGRSLPALLKARLALPARVFPGGGVELEHRGPGFEADWTVRGKKLAPRERGVLVPAGTTIVHKLPFARPRAARVEVSFIKATPRSAFVLLLGDKGIGVNGALVPVRRGVPFSGDQARDDAPFLPGQPYGIDVEVFAPLPDGRVAFKATLSGDKRPGERGVVDAAELGGSFGIAVEADVEVQFIRLAGVVDPAALTNK